VGGGELLQKLPTKELKPPRLSDIKHLMFNNPRLQDACSALCAGIRLNGKFDSGGSILVTSAEPREGKTTISACLAITAALAGQTALLIDGDLRRPWMVSARGSWSGLGLGEVLSGEVDPSEAIHVVDLLEDTPDAGVLSVMSAGRKSPSIHPAVDWSKARATFQLISSQFGIVVLDSPPVLAAADALLLARIVDAVLLVIGAGSADRNEVRRVKEQLEQAGTPIIGAALNKFDEKLHGRSSQPYGAYYHSDHR
jgi:capsular exopolysaccharide synthesis family protein